MEATDFATGHWVDATHAVYVSDSDMHPCGEMNTMRDPQGCCLMKTYDRWPAEPRGVCAKGEAPRSKRTTAANSWRFRDFQEVALRISLF